MGTTLIFVGQWVVTDEISCRGLLDVPWQRPRSRKQLPHQTVPETDTGGQVEHTKALERMTLKELGNLPP